MGNMEQVIENLAYAEHSQPHNLTSDELALVSKARDAYVSLTAVACTGANIVCRVPTMSISPESSNSTTKR